MPSVNPELLARLAEEQPDPSAVSAFAQRLVADPAPEVALTEVLAGLPDASVRILSAALAEQLALEASALDDRDASEVLHHAAALYGLTGKGGAGQARCLAEAYTRFPSLGTLNTVDALLGRRDSDSQLAARAQLDSSEEGLKALTTIVERWLDAGRFEHVVELLGSAAEVHGEARELLRGLMEEVNADRAEPEESASDDGASAETTDAAPDETLEVQSESPHTAVGEPAQVEEVPAEKERPEEPDVQAASVEHGDEPALQGTFSFDEEPETDAPEAPDDAPVEVAPQEGADDEALAAAKAAEEALQHVSRVMNERLALRALRASGDVEGQRGALSDPTSPPEGVLETLASAQRQSDKGDHEEAASILAGAIRQVEEADEKFALMVVLGRIYECDLLDPLRAERVYRRMRGINPRAIEALSFYRDWERLGENPKQAYELLSLLHDELQPVDFAEERLAIAMALIGLTEGKLRAASLKVQAWRRVLFDEPTHVRARRTLVTLYTELEQWSDLATHLDQWVEALPESEKDQRVRLLFELIGVYQGSDQLSDDARVIDTYQRILAIAPNEVRAIDQLAARYEDRERWSDLAYVLAKKIEATDEPAEQVKLFGEVASLYLERVQSDKDAIPVLERILDIDPGNIEVTRQLRELYERQHDSRHLYETFQRELTQLEGADRIDVLIELARLADGALELPDQAASWWKEVLKLEPDHRVATKALEMLRVSQEDWSDYAALLKQRVDAAKTRKARVEALLELGEMTYNNLEDEEAATAIFAQVCELSPFNNHARSFLQQIYVKKREWERLEGLYAPRADWDGYLGLLRDTARGNRDLALVADIQVEMARVAAEQLDEPQRARTYLTQALEGSPQRVDVAHLLLEEHGERLSDDARLSAHEVIARHSDDGLAREDAWLAVAQLRQAQDDPHGTFAAYGESLLLSASRGAAPLLEEFLETATALHAWEDARELLDDALTKLPQGEDDDTAEIALHRALGHLHRGRLSDPDNAVNAFREVLRLVPGDTDALDSLEAIHLSRNDLESLEEVWRARADHSPDAGVVRTSLQELGKLYEEVLFDSEQAANTYRELLDVDPNDDAPLHDLERVLLVAGAHARLAEAIEDLLPLMERATPRRQWRFRLASLYRDDLSDPHAAVDHIRTLILEEGIKREESITLLEAMFEGEEAMAPVANLLATVYESRGDDERLATTLEACLRVATSRDEKLSIVDSLLPLQEVQLGLTGQAFTTLSVRFHLDPDDRDTWTKLRQLATDSGKEGELAELWRAALASRESKGHPSSLHGVNLLRVTLARFVRTQFNEFEEPLDLLEAILSDADNPGDYPELLEELEALHSARQDPEALVRVLLASSRALLDSARRQEKILEACALLRGELERPEDALTHYLGLYAEDPNDQGVATAIEDTFTHLAAWARLAEWLKQHADNLVSPERVADAQVRLLVLRHDRLDDQEAAYAELRKLAEQEETASRARGVLVDFARRPEITDEQRRTLLDWVEALARNDDDDWALAHVFEARTLSFTKETDRSQFLFSAAKLLIKRIPLPDEFSDTRRALKAFELAALSLREEPAREEASAWLDALVAFVDLWRPYTETCEDAASRAEGGRRAELLARAARASEEQLEELDRALDNWRAALACYQDETSVGAQRALEELERLFSANALDDARIDLYAERAERSDDLGHRTRLLRTRVQLLEALGRTDEAVAGLHEIVGLASGDVPEDVAEVRDDAMERLESLLTGQGRSTAVVELLTESASNTPDDAVATRWLIAAADIAEQRLEEPQEAARIFELLLARVPLNEEAHVALDRIYREANEWGRLADVLEGQYNAWLEFGDNQAALNTLFKLGQLSRNRIGDEERAVKAYATCVDLAPDHAGAIEALRAASERNQHGAKARGALSDAYRRTENWALLAEVLRDRIAQGDAKSTEDILKAELASLCLDRLSDEEGAWSPALASFKAAATEALILERRKLLTRAGLAVGEHDTLVSALLEGAKGIASPTVRAQMLAETGQELIEGGIDSDQLEAIWRATVDADLSQSLALTRLEALLRKVEDRSGELADVLALKEAQAPEDEGLEIRRERGLILAKLPGHEGEAFECLMGFAGEAQLDDLLTRLSEECGQWHFLADLLAGQLERCDEGDVTPLTRHLGEVLWRHLGMSDEAVSRFADVLKGCPGEPATIAHLEAMWSEETEREPVFNMLAGHYEATEAWEDFIALHEAAAIDEALADHRSENLEAVARTQLDKLRDADAAFETTKQLVREAGDPTERADQFERLAELSQRWEDVAQFYEGLVIEGHASLAFVQRLASVCKTQLEDSERAIRAYKLAASRNPNDDLYDDALGALVESEGAWEALLDHYRATANAATDTGRIIAARLHASQLLIDELSRPLEAARELEKAAQLAPKDEDIAERLAAALEAADERDTLVAHYRTWLTHADEEKQPALRCRLAGAMLTRVVDASEAIRLMAAELEGPAREVALDYLTRFLRDSRGSGEVWRRPIEAAAELYEQTLGDTLTEAQLAVTEAARLRVLPEGPEQQNRRLKLAEILESEGDLEASFSLYGHALRSAQGSSDIESALERLSAADSRWPDLAQLYTELLKEVRGKGTRARLLPKLARIHRDQLEDMEGAAQCYEQLLEIEQDSQEALSALSDHYASTGAAEDEARVLECWRTSPSAGELREQLSERLALVCMDHLKDTNRALSLFESLLPNVAHKASCAERMVSLYEHSQRWDRLMSLCDIVLSNEALALEARVAWWLRKADIAERGLGNLQSAAEALRHALTLTPDTRDALVQLARLERTRKNWDALDEVLAEHLTLDLDAEEEFSLHIARAELAFEQKNQPELALSHLARTDSLSEGEFDQKLIALLEKLMDAKATRSEAARRLQIPYRALKRWEALYQVLIKQLELEGRKDNVSLTMEAMSVARDHLRDPRLALETALPTFRLTPADLQLRNAIEELGEETGYWDEIFEESEGVLQSIADASLRGAHARWIGDTMVAQDRPESAVWAYEAVLDALPSDRGAMEALEELHGSALRYRAQRDVLQLQLDVLALTDGERATVLLRLATLQEEALSDSEGARDSATEALALNPASHQALEMIARAARAAEDWQALESALARHCDLMSDPAETVTLLLERAMIAKDHLGDLNASVELAVQADTLVPAGPGREDVSALLTTLSELEEVQARAAMRLEGRLSATNDWEGVSEMIAIQLEHCDIAETGEALTRRWARVLDKQDNTGARSLQALVSGAERFPERQALWEEAGQRAEAQATWTELFAAGGRAIAQMPVCPDKVSLGLWLADKLESHGGEASAVQHALESVLLAAPQHEGAYARLESMHQKSGNDAGLLVLLDLALAADELPKERRIELLTRKRAIANSSLDHVEALRDACSTLLELRPQDQEALRVLERLANDDDDWEALDLVLQRRLDVAGDKSAKIALGLQRAENALDRLSKPEAALSHAMGADALVGPGPGHEGLIEIFESLLEHESTREAAASRLETRYRVRKDWARLFNALAVLRTTLSAGEQVEALTLEMVRLAREELSDPSAALSTALDGFKSFPDRNGLRDWIVELAEETEGWPEVFATIEEVLKRSEDGGPTEALALWLAGLYVERGAHQAEAIRTYERVLVSDDENLRAMDALEALYAEADTLPPLLALLERRLKFVKESERADVLQRLAEWTHKDSGAVAAMTWWKELLWERPEHGAARRAVSELLELEETADTAAGLLEPLFQREEDWAGLVRVLASRARRERDPAKNVALWMRLASLRETELNDASGAFEAFAKALHSAPERRDVLRGLERMAERSDRWSDLSEELEALVAAIDIPSRQTELLVRLGEVYESRLSRYDRAIDSLRKALQLDDENRSVLKGLRRLYRHEKQHEPLLEMTRRLALLARRPLEARELWAAVQSLCTDLGDEPGVLEATRKILEYNPEDDVAAARLIELLEATEGYDELGEILERRANESNSAEKTAESLVHLAQIRETRQDNPKGALAAYLQALEHVPTHEKAFEAVQERYREAERWADLLAVSRRRAESLVESSEAASAWIAVAQLASVEMGEAKEATRALEKALALDKHNQDVLRELGRLAEREGRIEDFLGYLTQLAEVIEEPASRRDERVRAAVIYMEQLGEVGKADALLEAVLSEVPDHESAVEAMARLRSSQARYAEAAGLLERVVRGRSGRARMDALCSLAGLYDDYLGRTQDARELLRQALEDPEAERYIVQLAELLEQTASWADLVALRERQYEEAEEPNEQSDRALTLALLHLKRLDNEEGFELWIDRAQDARRDNPKVVEALIDFYTRREQWDRVAPRLEWLVRYLEAKRLTDALAVRAHQLANLMDRLGQPHEALDYFKLSMQTDGTYLPNIVDYGSFLISQERWERALRVHQNLLVQSRKLSDEAQAKVLYHLALACHNLDQRDKTELYLTRLLTLDPEHADGLRLRALSKGESSL